MQPDDEEISSPDDIQPVFEVVVLPVPTSSGKRLRIKLRALQFEEVLIVTKGVPAISGMAEAERKKYLQTDEGRRAAEELVVGWAGAGIVAPPFSFGPEPEPGKAHWASLSIVNQTFIVQRIQRISGLGGADELASFLREAGGSAAGGAHRHARKAAASAARGGRKKGR